VSRKSELSEVARSQAGYFTAKQALDSGYSYPNQKHHVEQGNWRRVSRGIFCFPDWPIDLNDQLAYWSLWSKNRGVVSHESALGVHELGDSNPAMLQMTLPRKFQGRVEGVKLFVNELASDEIIDRGSYKVTTPLRSVMDTASYLGSFTTISEAIRDGLDMNMFTMVEIVSGAEKLEAAASLRIIQAVRDIENEI